MDLKLAVGFDQVKQDEVFAVVSFTKEAIAEIVVGFFNHMTYEQRLKWLAQHKQSSYHPA